MSPGGDSRGESRRAWLAEWRAEWTVALLLAALAFVLAASGWTWRGDRVIYDFALGAWRRPPPPDIVIVAIDEHSIEAIGRWPWPRAVHSTLLDQLAQAKPRAIALDLILSEADPDPAQDRLLAQLLERAAPVVMPVAWQSVGAGVPPRLLTPTAEITSAVLLGAAVPAVDADGVLRHTFLHTGHAKQVFPHLALALLQAGGETLDPRFPVVAESSVSSEAAADRSDGFHADRFLIRYAGPPGHLRRVSYVDVLRGAVPPEVLAGRYVLIGMTALGLGDTLATPVNRQQHAMAGVEVLGNTLYTLRSGDTLRVLPQGLAAALAATLLLLLVLAFELVGTRWALALALGFVPFVLCASMLAVGLGWWWGPLPCALAAALAYPFWSWRRLERAVDSLDLEIRNLAPEGGLQAQAVSAFSASFDPRDRLASRLETLHVATDTVRSARRFLADALAGMPTAMLVADESGRVLLANTLSTRLFEVDSAQAMQGLDLQGLLVEFGTPQPMDWQAVLSPKSTAPAGTVSAGTISTRTISAGTISAGTISAGTASAGIAPAETTPGSLVVEAQLPRLGDFLLHFASVVMLGERRWVVTFADVTAIKQAQRRRDETLAFVTHDLRSPASSIMLLADLHLQGHMSMAYPELLAEVHRLAARTLQLSDDIVRVAHAESRPLNLAPVGLAALLDEVLADFRPQALNVEVTLRASAHNVQASWLLDRTLVLRALGNLVSNAIKHSPCGSVVELVSRPHEDGLVLAVSDAGAGLSAPQQRKLLNESQGLPAGDARGVGLGLLFVQRVAGRHRGRLLAHTGANGVGTVFELHLGEAPAAAAQA